MAFSVVMPALEMAQETGKLIAWRKKEGESVKKGEPLLEIETDKAVMEIESPADGILAGVTGKIGTDIQVGKTIAWIVAPGEKPPAEEASPSAPAARASSQPKAEAPTAPSVAGATPASETTARISPKARRLAKELGVDLSKVQGSGAGGEILASDIQAAASSSSSPPATNATKPLPGNLEVPTTLGRIMAERTTQSWTSVPHFFVTREVDASALNQFRDKLVAEIEREHQVRVTHTDLLVALAARVLLKHPRVNSSWTTEGIRLHDHVNMGVAIAVNDGVVAAVIPNAHSTSLPEIAKHRRGIAERARDGKLHPEDIAGATFTISNLGMYKVDQFSAIITPPQAAILAVGSIVDRVVAVNGQPAVRPMMTMTISADHRAADGARAAEFMRDLADAILDPGKLLA